MFQLFDYFTDSFNKSDVSKKERLEFYSIFSKIFKLNFDGNMTHECTRTQPIKAPASLHSALSTPKEDGQLAT